MATELEKSDDALRAGVNPDLFRLIFRDRPETAAIHARTSVAITKFYSLLIGD